MPLRTKRYNFTDEIDRIADEIADLQARLDDLDEADGDTDQAIKTVRGQITWLEAQQRGARWARDEAHLSADEGGVVSWDHQVDSVELAGLTGGELARVSKEVTDPIPAVRRIHMVALGTEDAPFHDETAPYGDRVATVGDLPAAYIKWAYGRVDDLSTVGNSGGTASKHSPTATRSQTSTNN
ncbi:hypothetical protein C453_12636 [Haloferax elongans ATCC BAA-1513]|uniref:Uncharacterized protein n=1 Tax=Haloferax elongans ATCC BAA-1513 TaxID=1230453 RepID=M0HKY8_HALEO|nr:hypothetical protein [Haloferax elongans]ELZ84392.1 hypothetical protein C453_12636 [Haloferax elongans ATCC BAA-1513]